MAKIRDLLRVDLKAIDDKVNRNSKPKRVTVDWSLPFSEEGHLCVTRIMDMLPKLMKAPDAHKSLWISYRRLLCASLGLADYNRRNEVRPVLSTTSLF
ncbi:hypothetical protein KSS87_005502 [Heliosperma pusillum]|nr:hypothetical protein KSS87_005502 [Heliosperma pusillum]